MDGVLEELKRPALQDPGVVAVAVMTRQDTLVGGPGFCRRPDLSRGDALLERLEFRAYPLHRLLAFGALVRFALLTVHDEHAYAGMIPRHFLDPRLRRRRALPRPDPHRALQPGAGGPLDVRSHLWSTPPIEPHHVALSAGSEELDIRRRHHAAIADKDAPP